jgi:alkanesulfonate monooxygenase SsuD/methylene tetrahydromethanopterin reductase-like flavin-dependent oxidoreductase (luciferase family)
MKFGVQMFPTDYAIPVTELARACEDLGFESLFFPEHTHIPPAGARPGPVARRCRRSTRIRSTRLSPAARRRPSPQH